MQGRGTGAEAVEKTQKRWNKVLIALALFLFVVSVVTFDHRPQAAAHSAADLEARARQAATEVINKAINEKVVLAIRYEQLITIRPDSQGKIAMLQYNTGEISRLSAITAVHVQSALKEITSIKIRIPLGQVLGAKFSLPVSCHLR